MKSKIPKTKERRILMKSKKKAMNINKMKKEIKRNNLDSIGCYNNSTINISRNNDKSYTK